MAKVDIELVKRVLSRSLEDTNKVMEIIEELTEEVNAQQEEPKPPPVKKQFAIMISDPQEKLVGTDFVGWVLQIPEEDSPAVAEERIFRSAYEFNVTPKGRRVPVKTVGEACEAVSARIFKEQNIWVKTKEPVLVLRTNNKIPMLKDNKF